MPTTDEPVEPPELSHRPAGAASDASVAADPEFATPWRAGVAYGLLALVLLLTVALPIFTFWHGTTLTVDTLGSGGLFQGQLVLAAFLLGWFVLQRRAGLRAFLHLSAGAWGRRLTDGLWTGFRGWLVTMVVMAALGVAARGTGVQPNAGFADLIVWMARRPFLLRVAVIVTAMIVEEAFFRAFLQPRVGLVLATMLFALSHVNYGSPTMGGGVFVIGWILGRAFTRTDDLAVCAVAHGTFDAIQLLVVLPLVASQL
ncbi:MAG TPA: type II CAAX endopeptidase family protein [Candidatus Binatia bacterium]|jgi:membrane protease YdiL (CAAX protease family)